MIDLLLDDYQAALRETYDQTGVVTSLYQASDGDHAERLSQLEAFRRVLKDALSREDLLPTEPDPEKIALKRFGAGIADALTEERESLIAMEEAQLAEVCAKLQRFDDRLSPDIRRGIENSRRAASRRA